MKIKVEFVMRTEFEEKVVEIDDLDTDSELVEIEEEVEELAS